VLAVFSFCIAKKIATGKPFQKIASKVSVYLFAAFRMCIIINVIEMTEVYTRFISVSTNWAQCRRKPE